MILLMWINFSYIMAAHAFVVAKEVSYHNSRDNFTPRERLNDEKWYFYVIACLLINIFILWRI